MQSYDDTVKNRSKLSTGVARAWAGGSALLLAACLAMTQPAWAALPEPIVLADIPPLPPAIKLPDSVTSGDYTKAGDSPRLRSIQAQEDLYEAQNMEERGTINQMAKDYNKAVEDHGVDSIEALGAAARYWDHLKSTQSAANAAYKKLKGRIGHWMEEGEAGDPGGGGGEADFEARKDITLDDIDRHTLIANSACALEPSFCTNEIDALDPLVQEVNALYDMLNGLPEDGGDDISLTTVHNRVRLLELRSALYMRVAERNALLVGSRLVEQRSGASRPISLIKSGPREHHKSSGKPASARKRSVYKRRK